MRDGLHEDRVEASDGHCADAEGEAVDVGRARIVCRVEDAGCDEGYEGEDDEMDTVEVGVSACVDECM